MSSASVAVSYLDAQQAADFDKEMMAADLFSTDQLMELAGLSVAQAVVEQFNPALPENSSVLVVCGPGNNGGDGLVAARHLKLFGFASVTVLCKDYAQPGALKPGQEIYLRLMNQALLNGATVIHSLPSDYFSNKIDSASSTIIVDALFGYSFVGPARAPYADWIATITAAKLRCVAVDIPSGWHVNDGPVEGEPFIPPTVLVSLTLPKLGVKHFVGPHYVGGRFIPPSWSAKHGFVVPAYRGGDQIVRVDSVPSSASTSNL